jgi:hypothetical protein
MHIGIHKVGALHTPKFMGNAPMYMTDSKICVFVENLTLHIVHNANVQKIINYFTKQLLRFMKEKITTYIVLNDLSFVKIVITVQYLLCSHMFCSRTIEKLNYYLNSN